MLRVVKEGDLERESCGGWAGGGGRVGAVLMGDIENIRRMFARPVGQRLMDGFIV